MLLARSSFSFFSRSLYCSSNSADACVIDSFVVSNCLAAARFVVFILE